MRPIRLIVLTVAALLAALIAWPGSAGGATGPNGKIAYASNEDGDYDIYTINADGTDKLNLTSDFPADETSPDWSPDGAKIAFTSDRDGDQEIFVMNAADGSGASQLTANDGDGDWGPRWSPDGTKIAFTSTRDGDWEVFVMDSNGGGETNVTGPNQSLAYDDMTPSWSADGTRILFQGVRDGAWEILSANPDGTGEANLTADDDPPYANINWYPTYHPDGSKILYMSQPNNGSNDWDIWVMNPDGTGKENVLPDDQWQDVFPNWSPDGTKITFSGNRSEFGTEIFVMDYPPTTAAAAASTAGATVGSALSRDWVGTAVQVTKVPNTAGGLNPDWGPGAGGGGGGGTGPFTLTVSLAGTGRGKVISSPVGIKCGRDCSETYAAGTVVRLTPKALRGSAFVQWSGACTGSGACLVTMDAVKSVTATFNRVG